MIWETSQASTSELSVYTKIAVHPASSLQRDTSMICWTYVSRGRSLDCGVVEKISICTSSLAAISFLLCLYVLEQSLDSANAHNCPDRRYGNSLIFSGDLAMLDSRPALRGKPIMNKSMLRSFLVFAGLSAALGLQTSVSHAQSGPAVWVVPALTRVARDEAPVNRREIELWAARGEYESFQVVVRAPAGGLKNVNVAVSDLTGERGRISKAHAALSRQHY